MSNPTPAQNWFIVYEEQKVGPILKEDLIYRFLQGAVVAETLVWTDGMAEWVKFKDSSIYGDAQKAFAMKHQREAGQQKVELQERPKPKISVGKRAVSVSYAGFWIRFAAYLLDTVVLAVLARMMAKSIEVSFLALPSLQNLAPPATPENIMSVVVILFQMMSGFFYFAIIQPLLGVTLGKAVFGLRLVSDNLRPVTLWQGIGRYFGFILAMLPLGFGLVALSWNSKKQGWHDRLAKTLVVPKDVAE